MERYWCLQYLIQEHVEEIHATVWRENLVRLDHLPYMTKVYGLPELKAGTRVGLQVQDVDTLLVDLRTKFLRVLEDEPVQPLALDDADDESVGLESADLQSVDLQSADLENKVEVE
ncbi:MAG: RNB domain-containing ribonuclease, partial [Methylotenera sp.]